MYIVHGVAEKLDYQHTAAISYIINWFFELFCLSKGCAKYFNTKFNTLSIGERIMKIC